MLQHVCLTIVSYVVTELVWHTQVENDSVHSDGDEETAETVTDPQVMNVVKLSTSQALKPFLQQLFTAPRINHNYILMGCSWW